MGILRADVRIYVAKRRCALIPRKEIIMGLDIQKGDFLKRISAWLLDAVLSLCVATMLMSLLLVCSGYTKYYDVLEDAEKKYSEKYGIDLKISKDTFDKLSDEEKANYYAADEEFSKDQEVIRAYAMISNIMLAIISVSVLITFVILEFIVPLIFKYGRTLGKKIFGLAVIRTNCVKMSGQALFIRSIIGKCTIETMVPIYIVVMIMFGAIGVVGIGVLLLFLALQIFVLIYTNKNSRSAIHDLISDTMVVDMGSQMIFETEDELVAYKNKLHEEMVSKQDY